MKTILSLLFLILSSKNSYSDKNRFNVDILVIGGGTSGTMAGIQSARMGVKTIVVEETPWLGGMMTSAGVSAIDGNHNLPSGLWAEFRNELIKHYGSEEALASGWVSKVMFEPYVAQKILRQMCAREKNLTIISSVKFMDIKKKSEGWTVDFSDNITINAKILIDGTELGDVAAKVGVKYDVGMESKATYNERIAPEKANNIVQDLTYVAVLKEYNRDVTIFKPINYKKEDFICSCEKLCPDKKMDESTKSKEKND